MIKKIMHFLQNKIFIFKYKMGWVKLEELETEDFEAYDEDFEPTQKEIMLEQVYNNLNLIDLEELIDLQKTLKEYIEKEINYIETQIKEQDETL